MKPFIPYKNELIYHSEDTFKIIKYLEERGKVTVQPHTIERLYEEFSDIKYSAGWMGIDAMIERFDDNGDFEEVSILEEFADWLAEVEI